MIWVSSLSLSILMKQVFFVSIFEEAPDNSPNSDEELLT
jgi:hypothetical protein